MEQTRSDGCPPEGWVIPFLVHTAFFCANSNHPLAVLQSMDPSPPSVVGGKIPLPRACCSLLFPDHFNLATSSWASREGTMVPVLVSVVSTDWRILLWWLVGEAAGRHLPAVPSAHPGDAQRINQEIDQAGRSLLWWVGNPKGQANHNGCCKIHFWGKSYFLFVCFWGFFCFVFVLILLSVGCRWLGGVVCGFFVLFSPLVFIC